MREPKNAMRTNACALAAPRINASTRNLRAHARSRALTIHQWTEPSVHGAGGGRRMRCCHYSAATARGTRHRSRIGIRMRTTKSKFWLSKTATATNVQLRL